MKKLEVYFDYFCPYCYEGHKNLKEILSGNGDIDIIWMPCEAHPRPEIAGIYSDLAISDMFFVRDCGGDVGRYNDLVYEAHFKKHVRIDSSGVLGAVASQCGADGEELKKALSLGIYAEAVVRANIHAWDEKKWDAVPSYSYNGRELGSRSGCPVPLKTLEDFLKRQRKQ